MAIISNRPPMDRGKLVAGAAAWLAAPGPQKIGPGLVLSGGGELQNLGIQGCTHILKPLGKCVPVYMCSCITQMCMFT